MYAFFTEYRDLALSKEFFNSKMHFAECPLGDTRQTLFHETLLSVHRLTLGRACCAECPLRTLDKVYFYFFYFASQTFYGMFLHYVDLHVPFWDNYNSVFNS
jgi:hypothetical protein